MSRKSLNETTLCPRCNLALPEPTRLYQQPSPFKQYLGTPPLRTVSISADIVGNLKPYIKALDSDLIALDEEILKLRASLEVLESQREAASAHLRLHKSLLSRAHDLPTSILRRVFLYCLDNPTNGGSYDLLSIKRARDGRRAPWDLIAVCRRWRDVGTHLPGLWNAPSFVFDNEDKMFFNACHSGCNCFSTALTRAGEEPLTLDIDLDSQETGNTLCSIADIFPRVETLYLTGLPARFNHADSSDNWFPKLQRLGLTAKFGRIDFERTPYGQAMLLNWNAMLSIIRASAPPHELTLIHNLGDRIFSSSNIVLNPSALSFSLTALTTVTLGGGSLGAMVPLLCACPALTTLSIRDIDLDYVTRTAPRVKPIIVLPTLQSLNLSNIRTPSILSSFQCPQLEHLTAASYPPLEPIVLQEILSRSQCALQTLDVQVGESYLPLDSPQETTWRDMLPLLSRLRSLTLRLAGEKLTVRTLPLLMQPNGFPLLSSLIVHIRGSMEDLYGGCTLGRNIWSRPKETAEDALERFFEACVYKAGGGVLSSLEVNVMYPPFQMLDGYGNGLGISSLRQDSKLLARMRRWKAEGICVKASQRCRHFL
ncbi:hypothetical protein CYLTODRAFT_426192 [Cylindrobasidium torrendii FP15055 ss-10]|uniref:F-box domain-containing protein n=1 Tax=Cylindrobasidium torrendii FP15055 ss-10 TaxID=1314674 RepID=A0A0D7AY99_9AGAR|nr:hypothetical protein CYLTODRAFT_426192 [Cylindrobasidium torrendii FP15055 ss-10]